MAEYATPIKQQWHIDFNSKVVVHTIVFVVTMLLAALGHTWLNTSPLAVPNEAVQNTLMHAAVSLWSVVFVAGVATTLFLPISETWKHPLIAGLVGLYQSMLFGIVLHGTPFGYGAYFHDSYYISSSIVKYMTFHSFVDFNYQGLPAFYPPLYFYITGKLAVLFGIDPIAAPKFGVAASLVIIPFILQWLWMKCTSAWPATAMLLVLLSISFQFIKPYTALSAVLFLPWWLHYIEGISADETSPDSAPEHGLRFIAMGGLIGGLIFMTYYYPFFFGGIALLLTPLLRKLVGVSAPAISWRTRLSVLTVAALVSSIYWLPFLLSMIAVGGGEPLQNRWFHEGTTSIPLPFDPFSVGGFISALGVLYLTAYTPRGNPALAIAALILSAYLWFAAGLLGVFYDTGLLILLVSVFVTAWLFCAGILGASIVLQKNKYINSGILVVTSLIVLLLLMPTQRHNLISGSQSIKDAKDPNSYVNLTKTPIWAVQQMGNPSEQVILSNLEEMAVIAPIHFFVNNVAYFSHPSGLHTKRVDFLEQLTNVKDPRLFAAASQTNRYSPIDYLLISQSDYGYQLDFRVDNFPDGTKQRSIFGLSPSVFAEPYFTIASSPYDNSDFITLHTDQVPLSRSNLNNLSNMSYEWLLVTYQLYSTFEEHISSEYEQRLVEVKQALITRRAEASSLSAEDQQALKDILEDEGGYDDE